MLTGDVKNEWKKIHYVLECEMKKKDSDIEYKINDVSTR